MYNQVFEVELGLVSSSIFYWGDNNSYDKQELENVLESSLLSGTLTHIIGFFHNHTKVFYVKNCAFLRLCLSFCRKIKSDKRC